VNAATNEQLAGLLGQAAKAFRASGMLALASGCESAAAHRRAQDMRLWLATVREPLARDGWHALATAIEAAL
jgi:hypothetical protein